MKRIVLKVGSSVLTHKGEGIAKERVLNLVTLIAKLKKKYESRLRKLKQRLIELMIFTKLRDYRIASLAFLLALLLSEWVHRQK